mgnify:CR=1 FL=1
MCLEVEGLQRALGAHVPVHARVYVRALLKLRQFFVHIKADDNGQAQSHLISEK